MTFPSFTESHIRELTEILKDAYVHKGLSDLLRQCGIEDQPGGGSKPDRAFRALTNRQRADGCGNNVAAFIQAVLDPARFVGNNQQFGELRDRVNTILAFNGLHIGKGGRLQAVPKAATISEAEQRAGHLRYALLQRNVHHEVLRFCKPELLQENFFHAVLEATKSVAQKIRDKTGLIGDAAGIVDTAFSVKAPLLAINSLQTETEQSEQTGFNNLLKGMFGTFRNPTGHAPKITWNMDEQDALDLLSLVSYLHRRLDNAVSVPPKIIP